MTILLNPKEKLTAHDIRMGQVFTIDGVYYVILIIGAEWNGHVILPDPDRAIVAESGVPDVYYNLKLKPY